MITAADWARNWVQGMTNAADKIRAGVNRVTESPGIAAVQAQDKMRANWLASIDNGTWMGRMASMTLQQWQQGMINKGLPRIADGVRAAQGKVQAFATVALPVYQQLQSQIRQMPAVTPQDMEARVLAWMRGMRAAKPALRNYR